MEITPFINLGSAAVLVAAAWWFSRWLLRQQASGEWMSRREADNLRADRDARLAEKDDQIHREHAAQAEWRAAHETSEAARELLADHVRDLAAAVRDSNHFYAEFRATVQRWESDSEPPARG